MNKRLTWAELEKEIFTDEEIEASQKRVAKALITIDAISTSDLHSQNAKNGSASDPKASVEGSPGGLCNFPPPGKVEPST